MADKGKKPMAKDERTVAEVLAKQRSPAGCCERHADNMACSCLRDAQEREAKQRLAVRYGWDDERYGYPSPKTKQEEADGEG